MSSFFIDISIHEEKRGNNVLIKCPYCSYKYLRTYEAFRKHLSKYHKNESGYQAVKLQAVKLWRLYKGAIK